MSSKPNIDHIHLHLVDRLGFEVTIRYKTWHSRNTSVTGILLSIKPDREDTPENKNTPKKLITLRTIEKGEVIIDTTKINSNFM